MTIQFNDLTRNALLDVIESTNGASCSLRIYSGAQPANCAAANSGTLLAHINLPADWMAAASAGAKSKLGTWQDTSADGTGTAGHFRLFNSQATMDGTTCFMQGAITADMAIDNASIAATQVVTVATFTLTAPGA